MSKPWKFLWILMLVNTTAFVVAGLYRVPAWVVIGIELGLLLGYVFLVALTSPAQRLATQARHMNWVHSDTVRGYGGFKDAVMQRGDAIARISYAQKYVILEQPMYGLFKDFVEVERALSEWES